MEESVGESQVLYKMIILNRIRQTCQNKLFKILFSETRTARCPEQLLRANQGFLYISTSKHFEKIDGNGYILMKNIPACLDKVLYSITSWK